MQHVLTVVGGQGRRAVLWPQPNCRTRAHSIDVRLVRSWGTEARELRASIGEQSRLVGEFRRAVAQQKRIALCVAAGLGVEVPTRAKRKV